MKKLVIVIIIILSIVEAKAQTSVEADSAMYFWSNKREIGIDFTQFAANFIPFNLSRTNTGMVGIKSKFYDKKYAFRINFGSDLDVSNSTFFYLSVGYEKRKYLYKKFTYTSGLDAVTSVKFNQTNDENDLFVGLSRFYGLEYNISDKLFLGTEAIKIL